MTKHYQVVESEVLEHGHFVLSTNRLNSAYVTNYTMTSQNRRKSVEPGPVSFGLGKAGGQLCLGFSTRRDGDKDC